MPDILRVAIVTESFLPTLNGVTTSVCRVLEHLATRGHRALVVCPGPAPARFAGADVVTVPAVPVRGFPLGVPVPAVRRALAAFGPDVVHLASPFLLGGAGLGAARRLDVPVVAVYQTDVPGFAGRNHLSAAAPAARARLRRLHQRADLTLVPSRATLDALAADGVPRLAVWRRGVDTARFTPERRQGPGATALRRRLVPDGELLVGYIGRLAPEKRVERLRAIAGLPGVRLVVGGDGPSRRRVERALAPQGAHLLGRLDGDALADAFAALDVFVHTGTEETFGQTLQEAMASGVPVVAPASGGPLDLVTPGRNGLLHPPEDDAGLRAAVAGLAADPVARRRMAVAARAGVEDRTWDVLGDQLVEYYRRVLMVRAASRLAAGALVHAA